MNLNIEKDFITSTVCRPTALNTATLRPFYPLIKPGQAETCESVVLTDAIHEGLGGAGMAP
jgi:hypothetical protein